MSIVEKNGISYLDGELASEMLSTISEKIVGNILNKYLDGVNNMIKDGTDIEANEFLDFASISAGRGISEGSYDLYLEIGVKGEVLDLYMYETPNDAGNFIVTECVGIMELNSFGSVNNVLGIPHEEFGKSTKDYREAKRLVNNAEIEGDLNRISKKASNKKSIKND